MRLSLVILWFYLSVAFGQIVQGQSKVSLNLFFASNSSTLSSVEDAKIASFIKKTDSLEIDSVSILAYCDDIGRKEYNDTLSLKRANYVRDELTKLKLKSKSSLIVVGKGQLPLINLPEKNTEQQRTYNKRAEVTVVYKPIAKNKQINKPAIIHNEIISDSAKVGDKITLRDILFIGGEHELQPESDSSLNELLETLKIKKQYSIVILGHICCYPPGYDGMDMETGQNDLSVERAKVIYDYLIYNGIDSARLAYKGLGSDEPTGKGDYYDRRVEIQISAITGK